MAFLVPISRAISLTRLRKTVDRPRRAACYVACLSLALLWPRTTRGVAFAATPWFRISCANCSRQSRSIALSTCRRRPCQEDMREPLKAAGVIEIGQTRL